MLWLFTIVAGADRGAKHLIVPPCDFEMGRGEETSLVLRDESVSRVHAKLTAREESLSILDLGSENGTFINGVQAAPKEIKDGDRLFVGSVVIRVNAVAARPDDAELVVVRVRPHGERHNNVGRETHPLRLLTDIPVPDLIAVCETSKRTCRLNLKTFGNVVAGISFWKGKIVAVAIDGKRSLEKEEALAMARELLPWTGFYDHGMLDQDLAKENVASILTLAEILGTTGVRDDSVVAPNTAGENEES